MRLNDEVGRRGCAAPNEADLSTSSILSLLNEYAARDRSNC
jgi:hypothetical protein